MRRFLERVRFDVRSAWTTLRGHPAFAVTAVLMLAVGIGINVAVFTVVDATLFRGFRLVDGNDRLLYIGTQLEGRGCCVSYPDFQDWRAQARSFAGMGAVADLQISLVDAGFAPEHHTATRVTANTFAVLGQRPILGRDFVTADEAPGAPAVAILGYRLWERRYAGDRGIVGHAIRINGTPTTVVGVMPKGFSFPQNQDLWLPLVPTRDLQPRNARSIWFAFGRLADGASRESARAELIAIGQRLAVAYPLTNQGWVPTPRTFAEFFVAMDAPRIYGVLWGVVACVLVITCANLANLLLVRTLQRSRDLSVRLALGAPRSRIIRPLVVEGLMLSCAGSALGWWIAAQSVRLYESFANPPTRSWSEGLLDYSMDARVFLYAAGLLIATVLMFSMVPAIRAACLDVSAALREGGRGTTDGKSGRRMATVLIVAQLALTLVLLSSAGVMIRSFVALYAADLGVDTERMLVAFINLPQERYPDAARQRSFFDRLQENLEGHPGVEAVSVASAPPATGSAQVGYQLADGSFVDGPNRPVVATVIVGPEYFRTLGVSLQSGRSFSDADRDVQDPPVIVNQAFASQHWRGQDAIGKRLRLYRGAVPGAWSVVVGVAPNVAQDAARLKETPMVYTSYRGQLSDGVWILARTRVPPASLSGGLRREVQALDPDLPVWLGPYPLAERLAGSNGFWSIRTNALLLTVFAAAALLIASTGFYAVVSQSVSRRTQEIALRLAIGASARDIIGLVLREGLLPLSIGLAGGLAGSLAVNRLLDTQLVRVSPADPLTFAGTSAVLIGCAVLGCLVPACRALRVDPLVALRRD